MKSTTTVIEEQSQRKTSSIATVVIASDDLGMKTPFDLTIVVIWIFIHQAFLMHRGSVDAELRVHFVRLLVYGMENYLRVFFIQRVPFINHRNMDSVQIVFLIHTGDTPCHTDLQISSEDLAK
jgi:hypothetical protein